MHSEYTKTGLSAGTVRNAEGRLLGTITQSSALRTQHSFPLPAPRVPISIRPGTSGDIPFIDALQKAHTKQVGWMPGQQLEEKIGAGQVLLAEQTSEVRDQKSDGARHASLSPLTSDRCGSDLCHAPVGYVIGQDRYFKRDDCGIIYQLGVEPGMRRSLVGATLIKAMFDRAAYGCKLFCCWCAQDIEANCFWESLGFLPLAFRAGSRAKGRIHIFWQRRIRAGDTTTPYWFPSQTTSGSIREDRIVLPIPPGTYWRDVKLIVLPGWAEDQTKRLPAPKQKKRKDSKRIKPSTAPAGGLWFAVPAPADPEPKPKRAPGNPRVKNDPKHVAMARELRDRWLEQVNSGQGLPELAGKYEVGRLAA